MIKSNWKSSSLFCLLFPLASCCRTLPWDKWKNVLPVCIRDLTGSISAPIRFVSWGNCWIRCVPKSIFRIGKNILCMNLSDSMYVVLSSNSWCPMKIVTTPIPYSMYLGSIIYLIDSFIKVSRGVALGVEFEIGKGGHLRPLAATCRKRPLAVTCGHLPSAATCGHLRPLALCGHLRSLAATCPLRSLALCGQLEIFQARSWKMSDIFHVVGLQKGSMEREFCDIEANQPVSQ